MERKVSTDPTQLPGDPGREFPGTETDVLREHIYGQYCPISMGQCEGRMKSPENGGCHLPQP